MTNDWIDTFVGATSTNYAPEIFCRWAGISIIAGTLQKHVYTQTNIGNPLFPNLYVVLVSESGVDKSNTIRLARDLWYQVRGLNVVPSNLTKTAFLKHLNNVVSLVAPIDELSVFLPKYDNSFLTELSCIFDNPDKYCYSHETTNSVINNPNLNILSSTTPHLLNDIFPKTTWQQGFMGRIIFVFSSCTKTNVEVSHQKEISFDFLTPTLRSFYNLHGEFKWSPEANNAVNDWFQAGLSEIPNHPNFEGYRNRRTMFIIKLAMISAISAGHELSIKIEDYERARIWLNEIEVVMQMYLVIDGDK